MLHYDFKLAIILMAYFVLVKHFNNKSDGINLGLKICSFRVVVNLRAVNCGPTIHYVLLNGS